jgi:dipeptidyl aminopeptidase/acylaminoacyl peptidase
LLYNERGHQRLRLLEVTVATGEVHVVIDEFSPTFIHYSSDGKFELRWMADGSILWASERSGWNHLYRYSSETRSVLNAVTRGDWNVRRIEHIDEATGEIWFYAVGVRPEQDPYHEHLCRCRWDGSGFQVLTEGDGTHSIEWSPGRRWFIDRWSRVDLPPVTELRSADGKKICDLETADASELLAGRGRWPQRFAALGRDGKTMIYGLIHRPREFDPSRKYPVVENIYAGPHDYHVPKAFRAVWGHQQQIADRGFIVVQIDGMGTAWRSKAFHDVCWQNLRDGGFPDRIAWMRQAAVAHAELDLNRVGIYGGSAGGQNALAALLWHGDFYRAAVADCGCHDNRMDKIWWNEQWMGVPAGDVYERNSNRENARQLQGNLMLVVGELDRNVDPASTMQVARKLVEANRDFEMMVVPGAGHGACETPWASRRRLEFFVRHLQP